MAGLQCCTSFDHPCNKVTGGAVGFEMVCQVIFVALIPSEIESIQELCIVQAEITPKLIEYYLFYYSILS